MKVSVCHQPNSLLAKALTTKPLSESLQVMFDPYERFKGQEQGDRYHTDVTPEMHSYTTIQKKFLKDINTLGPHNFVE